MPPVTCDFSTSVRQRDSGSCKKKGAFAFVAEHKKESHLLSPANDLSRQCDGDRIVK